MRNDPDLEVYRRIFLAKDDSTNIDITTKATTGNPALRDFFSRAAQGESVLRDPGLSQAIWPEKLFIHVSKPNGIYFDPPSAKDFINAIRAQAGIQIDKPVNSDDIRAAVKSYTGLSDDANAEYLTKSLLKINKLEDSLKNKFSSPYVPGLNDEIESHLIKLARGISVSEDQIKKFEENLNRYASMNAISSEEITQRIEDYKKKIISSEIELINNFNDEFTGLKYIIGGVVSGTSIIVVGESSDSKNPQEQYAFFMGDMPAKPILGTPEQWELLFSIHEAEHLSKEEIDSDLNIDLLPHEIDADRAVLKVLEEMHEPYLKEYYLAARNVDSFKTDLSHATSTFLRIEERTGFQLNLDLYLQEREQLQDRVAQKLETNYLKINPKTADVMGAVQDLLREDDAQKDPAKKLSPIQRAEALWYLEDAQKLGFQANPNYPKPQRENPDPDPATVAVVQNLQNRALP